MSGLSLVLLLLLVGAIGAAGFLLAIFLGARSSLRQLHEANATLTKQGAELQARVQHLARYQAIADAEAAAAAVRSQTEGWAAQMVAAARADADRIVAQARATEAQAQTAAATSRTQMDAWVAQMTAHTRGEAERITGQATNEATRMVEDARRRAEGTAAEALAAVRDAKRLELTAQAMKNVIEGYGDRYVVPTSGLLDELAAEFGFAEAGQRLKGSRDHVRSMIRDGSAATCEYVEAHRRSTAIEFVLDAFNGKVDTILADVRHNNYGTLEQKVKDAFVLVNNNGRAFRDARIQPAYLDARLEELRWAVIATELKLKAREEQRILKERIREEERAQREFERAMKEAEKEEDSLRRAMEKARLDVAKATDEQRAMYEQQLMTLTEKLRAAEEKNQRALSMAQQTKAGHVYVISNVGSFGDDVFKIGMTRRLEPYDRVRELGDASVPFEFDVHAMIPSPDAPALEHSLHQKFVRTQVNKVNARKEFFRVPLSEVRDELTRIGVDVSWTLSAVAREFRETQAIERALANKTLSESAWAQQQSRAVDRADEEQEPVEATT